MTKRAVTIEVRTGEAVSVDGGRILAILEEKSGQRARIRFEVDEGTSVERVRDTHNIRATIGLGRATPQQQGST